MRPFAIFLLLVLSVAACDSNVVDPADDDPIVPGDVSFAASVLPILSASCSGSGCHVPGSQSGVTLANYLGVTTSVGTQYGTRIVVPGNAAASPLVEKIAGAPQFGVRMPLGASALSSAQIATIRTWVNEGAKNN